MKELFDMDDEAPGKNMNDDTLTRVNVWIINEPEMSTMISKILKPEDLENTLAIVVPDTEQPWDIMTHAEKWMNVLKEAVFELSPNLNLKTLERLKDRNVDLYKTYEEPEVDAEGKLINKKIKKRTMGQDMDEEENDVNVEYYDDDQNMQEELRKEMDLPEGVLVTNLFIPVVVVCSKSDLMDARNEKEIK
jgi:cell envelope opacity-associated protein A